MALGTLRFFRAFAWLRWRLLVNSIKGSRRRDAMERFSRTGSVLLRLVLLVALLPALLTAGLLGVIAGMALGAGGDPARVVLVLVRVFFAAIFLVVILAPALRSIRGSGSNFSRFILLPIPRWLLYTSDVASSLADPWIAMTVPVLLLIPVGLAVKGAFLSALLALAAGLVLLGTFLLLESTVSYVLNLLYRDRRRGEVVTLVVLATLSLSGLAPWLLSQSSRDRSRSSGDRSAATEAARSEGASSPRSEETRRGDDSRAASGGTKVPGAASEATHPGEVSSPPTEAGRTGEGASASEESHPQEAPASTGGTGQVSPASENRARPLRDGGTDHSRAALPSKDSRGVTLRISPWLGWIPSELYAGALRRSAEGRPASGALFLAGLVLFGAALTGVSWRVHRRILDSPEGGSSRRVSERPLALLGRIPGLGAAPSALAHAHIRLVLRTVQGKMALYFTPASMLVVVLVMTRFGGAGVWVLALGAFAGPTIATIGMAVSLLSLQKVMLNQFAVDGPGLTLQLLVPVSEREILTGKAVAMGLLFAGPSLFYVVATAILLPGGPLGLWVASALSGISAYLLFAPVAALLSALFPKPVSLSRSSTAANPHGFAAFLGFFVTVLLFVPPVSLALVGMFVLRSPS